MITTPLCSLLGITHPLLNASMAGTATFTTDTLISARNSGMSSTSRMRVCSGLKRVEAASGVVWVTGTG